MEDYAILVFGLVVLIIGGEVLVRNAQTVAEALGVSPLLIGIVLLGFGTSAPELVTSIQAAQIGSPGIAVGNFVGSNITNILLVIGVAALLSPIVISNAQANREAMMALVSAIAFAAVTIFYELNQLVGAVFVTAMAAYLIYAVQSERKLQSASPPTQSELDARPAVLLPAILAIVGLVAIVVGADFLVKAAVNIAQSWGVSESVIGVSVVAVGTSMPELVATTAAALSKRGNMALGSIIGSNIYNTFAIGGVTGLIAPAPVPSDIASYDIYIMVAVTIVLFAFVVSGRTLGRFIGAAFVFGYVAYIWSIFPH